MPWTLLTYIDNLSKVHRRGNGIITLEPLEVAADKGLVVAETNIISVRYHSLEFVLDRE